RGVPARGRPRLDARRAPPRGRAPRGSVRQPDPRPAGRLSRQREERRMNIVHFPHIAAILKKELRSYFASPLGYVFILFYLLVSCGFFVVIQDFVRANQAVMRGYVMIMPWILLFFLPAVTLRLWAEERKVGTLEALLTMPLREADVVLGKF